MGQTRRIPGKVKAGNDLRRLAFAQVRGLARWNFGAGCRRFEPCSPSPPDLASPLSAEREVGAMRTPAGISSRPATPAPAAARRRRRRAAIGSVAFAAVVLAGCGSSGSDEASTSSQDESFCSAVDEYVAASKAGDRTGMADALDGALDDVEGDAKQDVTAFVAALRSAPANESPDGDGVEADSTDDAFRAYVADTCGKDVELPEETDATTTEAPAPGSGGGGTTDDTGVDGSGTGTDAGSGTDTGGGMTGG